MTTGREAAVSVTRCGARTRFTAAQLATLSALPEPVEPVSPRLFCELADGHQDAHVASRGHHLVSTSCQGDWYSSARKYAAQSVIRR
jgi:hypothetical protein